MSGPRLIYDIFTVFHYKVSRPWVSCYDGVEMADKYF